MIVSYFTPSYKHHADKLLSRCNKLDIECQIIPIQPMSWIEAVRMKPTLILETIDYLRKDFIFLDVDCEIIKRPDFTMKNWGCDVRKDGTYHDYIHYVKAHEAQFVRHWITRTKELQQGSHTAFLSLEKECDLIPKGYFKLGISNDKSKTRYFSTR